MSSVVSVPLLEAMFLEQGPETNCGFLRHEIFRAQVNLPRIFNLIQA